jgi:hypothetical protein
MGSRGATLNHPGPTAGENGATVGAANSGNGANASVGNGNARNGGRNLSIVPSQGQSNGQNTAQAGGNNAGGQANARAGEPAHGGNAVNGRAVNGNAGNRGIAGLSVGVNGAVGLIASPDKVSPQRLQAAEVYARNGTPVGRIDQVLIDTRHGNVAFILLERGGFLGLAPSWTALPVQAITFGPYRGAGGQQFRLTVNLQRLSDVPTVPIREHLAVSRVPKAQLAHLYRHFGVQPYWRKASATGGEGQQGAAVEGRSASGPQQKPVQQKPVQRGGANQP